MPLLGAEGHLAGLGGTRGSAYPRPALGRERKEVAELLTRHRPRAAGS